MSDTTTPSPKPIPQVRGAAQRVQEKQAASPSLDFERSLAVVIGINDYQHGIPPLKTAVNDARRLAQILTDDYNYEAELLINDVTLTRLQILLNKNLKSSVDKDDRVLFYFAGHGIALDGDDGPAGYLIPQDGRAEDRSTFLSMDELHAALMALSCRHMLIILDSCFAGTMRWSSTRAIQWGLDVVHQERYERFIRDPAWQAITSTAYDQKALDIASGEVIGERGDNLAGKHSPFALALFDALAGAGDVVPKGKGDGVITASELYLYLRYVVENQENLQTPGLWPLKKHDRGEYIFLVPGHELNLPPAPELTTENNPYRGLKPFDEEHTNLFFGRSELVTQLAEAVEQQPLTVVLGASGTGKSSLVKAGLIPHLGGSSKADQLVTNQGPSPMNDPERGNYILPPIRPTGSPFKVLSELLNIPLSSSQPASTLADTLTTWAKSTPQQKLLLVIDQFEELITLCRSEQEQRRFIELLATAIESHSDRFRLVLTLRSDFEPQLSNSALKPCWSDGRFIITPMNQAELRQVIEEPASVRVLYFEPTELVDKLIDEVIQTPGALPLLSFTLSEMYIKYLERRSDNRALTAEDYEALGGVIGSLRNRATEEYERLDPAHQATMQRVMLRMISTEGGELTRRRVPRSELVYLDDTENRRVEMVLRRLQNARLIVSDESEGIPYVEPAHDALVRAWDKLLAWKGKAEETLPLQRRLTLAANDWENAVDQNDRNSLLWHDDPRLPQVEQILAGDATTSKPSWWRRQAGKFRELWRTKAIEPAAEHWLNKLELEFVQQSVNQRRKEARRLVSMVIAVMMVLAGLTIFAFIQQGIAEERRVVAETSQANEANSASTAVASEAAAVKDREAAETAEVNAIDAAATAVAERDIALSRQLAAQALTRLDIQPDLALLLGVEASRIVDTAEARGSLLTGIQHYPYAPTFLHGQFETVDTVAVSPDGKILAAGVCSVQKRVYSYNPCLQHGVQFWNVTTGQPIGNPHIGHSGKINEVAFHPDGQILASGSSDGTIILWDVVTGLPIGEPFTGHDASVNAVTFSADGEFLASGSNDRSVILWDVATGQPIGEPLIAQAYSTEVTDVVFSPDGQILVPRYSNTFIILLWDVATRQMHNVLLGHNDRVNSIVFSPDGKILASGSADQTTILWDVASGQPIGEPLNGHSDAVNSIAFSPDGQILASSSDDNTVILWDVATGQPVGEPLTGHNGNVESVGFSPDSKTLAIGTCQFTCDDVGQSEIRLWDVTTDKPSYKSFFAPGDTGSKLLFTSSGQVLITALESTYFENTKLNIILWDMMTDRFPSKHLVGHNSTFSDIAFSPDGKTLAAQASNRDIVLWDTTTGQAHSRPLAQGVRSMAFSPDGQTLAAGKMDGTIILWDVAAKQPLGEPFTGHTHEVASVVFSPDGQTLASGSRDETIILWDVSTGQPISEPLIGHTDPVLSVAFSPDEKILASGSVDWDIILWDVESHQPLYETLTGHSGDVESVAFSPDGQILASGSWDKTIILWDVATGQPIGEPLFGHLNEVVSVAFSPDGLLLASLGSRDGIILWDVNTGLRIGEPMRSSYVEGNLVFSPDGQFLASITADGHGIVLWDVRIEVWQKRACRMANRNLTHTEWAQYLPNQEYRLTCPDLP